MKGSDVRPCRCVCCRAAAGVHLLATDRPGMALAVLRGLPGDVAAALEVAREEGRQRGREEALRAVMHGPELVEAEAGKRGTRKPAKAPRRPVPPS